MGSSFQLSVKVTFQVQIGKQSIHGTVRMKDGDLIALDFSGI